jgi:hypothetical protein
MKNELVDKKDSSNLGNHVNPSTNLTPLIYKTINDEETKANVENEGQEPPTMSLNYLKCLRKRNAIYSKRKYYKNKMYFEELQRRKDELNDMNHKLRSENQQLEDLVQQAKDKVAIQARRQEIVKKLIAQQVQRQHQQVEQIRSRLTQRPMISGFAANATPQRSPMRATAVALQESLHFPLSPVTVLSRQVEVIKDFASRRTSALVEQALQQQRQQQRDFSLLFLQQHQVPNSFQAINTVQLRGSNHSDNRPSPSFRHKGPFTSDDGTGGRLLRAIEAAQSLNHNGTATSYEAYRTTLRNDNVDVQLQQQLSQTKPMAYATTAVASTEQKTSPLKNPQLSTGGMDIDLFGILEQYQTKKRLEAAGHAFNLVSDVTHTTTADLIQPQQEGRGQQSKQLLDEQLLSKIVNAGPAVSPDALLNAHLTLQQRNKRKTQTFRQSL